jgi:hypothetical protein
MQDLGVTVQGQSAMREDQTGGGVAQDDRNKQLIRFPIITSVMGSDKEDVLTLPASLRPKRSIGDDLNRSCSALESAEACHLPDLG